MLFPVHNNEKYWHTPRVFIPERFDPTNKYYKTPSGEKRHPCAFVPFSVGPRSCLGQNFAIMELKYLVIMLLSFWEFELADDLKERNTDISFAAMTYPILRMRIKRLTNQN